MQGFIRGQQALQFESEADGHDEQRGAERGPGHRRGHAPPRHRGQRTNVIGELRTYRPFFLVLCLFSHYHKYFLIICLFSLY